MTTGRRIRVLISMIGLDSHTTGAEVVATLLRDAGFEVLYLGTNKTPAMIVSALPAVRRVNSNTTARPTRL